MPRPLRYTPGGMVFHVLNRGLGRRWLFDKEDDFLAFETKSGSGLHCTLCVPKSARCRLPQLPGPGSLGPARVRAAGENTRKRWFNPQFWQLVNPAVNLPPPVFSAAGLPPGHVLRVARRSVAGQSWNRLGQARRPRSCDSCLSWFMVEAAARCGLQAGLESRPCRAGDYRAARSPGFHPCMASWAPLGPDRGRVPTCSDSCPCFIRGCSDNHDHKGCYLGARGRDQGGCRPRMKGATARQASLNHERHETHERGCESGEGGVRKPHDSGPGRSLPLPRTALSSATLRPLLPAPSSTAVCPLTSDGALTPQLSRVPKGRS